MVHQKHQRAVIEGHLMRKANQTSSGAIRAHQLRVAMSVRWSMMSKQCLRQC